MTTTPSDKSEDSMDDESCTGWFCSFETTARTDELTSENKSCTWFHQVVREASLKVLKELFDQAE